MNVKLIRMSSGEDVVANLIEEKEGSLVLEEPIVAVPAGNGQLGFAPWSPLLSEYQKELEVSRQFVVYIAEVQEDVVEQYEKMFATVKTPPKKKLIL